MLISKMKLKASWSLSRFLVCLCITPFLFLSSCAAIDIPNCTPLTKDDMVEFLTYDEVVLVGDVRELNAVMPRGSTRDDGSFVGTIYSLFEIQPIKFYKRPAGMNAGPFKAYLSRKVYEVGHLEIVPNVKDGARSFLALKDTPNSLAAFRIVAEATCQR